MKKIFYWLLVMSILFPVAPGAADMDHGLIAVAADESADTANVSSQAARCTYYMLFDGTGDLQEIVDNPYKDAGGGAGPSTVDFLSSKGATIVIAETFGDKMINAMKSKNMKYYELKGEAVGAVKEVIASHLP
jgi:predicted Fe-Mo cluster-binding NifX family protein